MSRVALVTGGNRGIGLSIAQLLRSGGYTVVVGSRTGTAPDGLNAVTMDVSSTESIDAGFTEIEEKFGPVEILIANAGMTRDTLLMRMTDEDIDEVINTNLAGSIKLARRALRSMLKARYGRIIFMSSVVGIIGSAGQVNYSAAKSGLIGAARSLVREVGGRGITVNVLTPGFVNTDMTADLGEERRSEIVSIVPLGRYAEPEEIATVVEFLVGDGSGYITGAVIPIDGGLGMGD